MMTSSISLEICPPPAPKVPAPYVGRVVGPSFTRLVSPHERFQVGEFVAVMNTFNGSLYLTNILESCPHGTYFLRGVAPGSLIMAHETQLRKLKKSILKVILVYCVVHQRISLPFRKGLEEQTEEPSYKEAVGPRMRNTGERFRLGELVFVQQQKCSLEGPCFLGRIVKVSKGSVSVQQSGQLTLYTGSFKYLRKVQSYPALESIFVASPRVAPPLDTVAQLVELYSGRVYCSPCSRGLLLDQALFSLRVLKDQIRFLSTLDQHNKQFCSRLDAVRYQNSIAGSFEELLLPNEDNVSFQADLHADLPSLLELLSMLQEEKFLDAQYICAPSFHLVFLGDYLDRGEYPLEVLTLLLRLRMQNPNSVHLLRGNHEMQDASCRSPWMNEFFATFSKSLEDCFSTFPLALAIGCKERTEKGIHEYVHCSHGLFAPGLLASIPLQKRDGLLPIYRKLPCEALEKAPHFSSPKVERCRKEIFERAKTSPEWLESTCYIWSDVLSNIPGVVPRDIRYSLSSEEIQSSFRAFRGADTKICATFRGHQHRFMEHTVPSKSRPEKVVATTLAATALSGVYEKTEHMLNIPSVLLQVAPRVRDWKKFAVLSEVDRTLDERPRFRIHVEPVGMYDKLLNAHNELSHCP